MYQYIIFDMDGTILDSKEGVFNSVRYALNKMGLPDPGDTVLEDFMGPPLPESFSKWFNLSGEDNEKAIQTYREYYVDKGMLECRLYPGMKDLLKALTDSGITLAIASSKPEPYVKKILDEFDIAGYFTAVSGAGMDEGKSSKEDVLNEAFRMLRERDGHKCRASNILMAGDRKFDINAANKAGFSSLAVTYGYGSIEELTQCSPDHLSDTMDDIFQAATGIKPYMRVPKQAAILKTVKVLTPLLLYWLIELLVYNISAYIVSMVSSYEKAVSPDMSAILNALAAISVWPYLAVCYKKDKPEDISDMVTKRRLTLLKRDWPLITAYSLALSLGLNLMLQFIGFVNISDSYEKTAATQYGAFFPLGLVVYGILTPFTEELLFRGVMKNRLQRFFPTALVLPMDALIFGCYHGNPVQMLYAFIMGLALATVYHYYGHLAAPLIMHISANLLIYILTRTYGIASSGASLIFAFVLLTAAAMCSAFYAGRLIKRAHMK